MTTNWSLFRLACFPFWVFFWKLRALFFIYLLAFNYLWNDSMIDMDESDTIRYDSWSGINPIRYNLDNLRLSVILKSRRSPSPFNGKKNMHIFLSTFIWFNFEFLSFCITCRPFYTLFVILFVFKHRYIKTIFFYTGIAAPFAIRPNVSAKYTVSFGSTCL